MKTIRFLFATGSLMLAIALIFSCSSESGDGDKQNSDSGLASDTGLCLVNGVCTSLAFDACIELGGQPTQSCPVSTSSSSATLRSSSSSVVEQKDYCVYMEIQQCYFGPYSVCPGVGGTLSDYCPYNSSSSVASSSSSFVVGSSSSVLQSSESSSSSSAVREYDYCVFVSDKMCLTGPMSDCPPGGTLSNSCPYGSSSSVAVSSSSTQPSSSSTLPSSSSTPECNGTPYNPTTQRCQNNVIETKCGISWYDATNTNLRCQSNIIETKCGTGWYNTKDVNLRCESNVVETQCGTSWYDATDANLRCESNVIETKCGTSWYNATYANLRCESNVVETQCGTDWYNATTQFCSSTTIYNKCGGVTAYNPETEQCCGTSKYAPATQFCDSRDSKAYKWVIIGTQTWMAENLNYNARGSKCNNNNTANCITYGRLYDWATAMGISSSYNSSSYNPSASTKYPGVCPSGWHLPSNTEWEALLTTVGGSSTAGPKLKATSGWGSSSGTNDYGFSALPGGSGSDNIGSVGRWWTATEEVDTFATRRDIYSDATGVPNYPGFKSYFFSVRCVQD